MLVSHGAMIIVMDGAKMSLFRNQRKDFSADLELIERDEKYTTSTAELGADKPGRNFNSKGQNRSSYESTEYHQVEEDDFAKAATEKLNGFAQQSNLDFIVVAAPRVLGTMRRHYSANLRKRLIAEIDKDYAGQSAIKIAQLLRQYEP